MERIKAHQAMSIGKPRKIEYEYKRHGTTSLMAAYNVADGKIIHHRLSQTRDEEDFLAFAKATAALLPQEDEIIFMADQLNIHMSESLVRWVAEEINFDQPLGTKGYKGILKSMKSRKAFLETQQHRIRFVFTPKHCSWLNPIENWFGKLQRHVITYGNFSNVKELECKIEDYIEYYNRCLKKPLNWKFKGFKKAAKIKKLAA